MSLGYFGVVMYLQPSVLMGCFTYGCRMSEMSERVWIAKE